jgi:seryl-tRNA synthetase
MPMYKGDGVKLLWAMITYFMKKHDEDGFIGIIPPHLLNEESAFVAGQLPKFHEDVYWTQDDTCLLPTAETALVNLHRDESLSGDELPKLYYAYTPCYRREAGAYGARDRGLMRLHQFHKVEMFVYSSEEDSDKELEKLVEKAESLVRDLGLKYRVVKLAGKELSFAMAKTIDIEIWLPFDKAWTEVSSISNARDFPSRRGNMRYRTKNRKLEYVHTLNGSGLATPRLMVGILEAYQQEDGSIEVPEVLRDYVGKDVITAT